MDFTIEVSKENTWFVKKTYSDFLLFFKEIEKLNTSFLLPKMKNNEEITIEDLRPLETLLNDILVGCNEELKIRVIF